MIKNLKITTIMAIIVSLFIFVGCDSKYDKDYNADQDVTIVTEMSDKELMEKVAEGQEISGDYFNFQRSNTFSAEELEDDKEYILTSCDVNTEEYVIEKYKVSLDVRTDSSNEEMFKGYIKSKIKLDYRCIGKSYVITKTIDTNIYIKGQYVYMEHTTDDDTTKMILFESLDENIQPKFDLGSIIREYIPNITEKGTDKEGNIVIQNDSTITENENGVLRLVLDSNGKLIFTSVCKGNIVINTAIDYYKKSIRFPKDLDTYIETGHAEMTSMTVSSLMFMAMVS